MVFHTKMRVLPGSSGKVTGDYYISRRANVELQVKDMIQPVADWKD